MTTSYSTTLLQQAVVSKNKFDSVFFTQIL